ncbi:MAG TPA: type II toxin-antitoxin system VapB family antitoxin [Candidatus Paceibacterota bacterium]|nr:type II toxin-antitoxin system VapB family antitoxin [Verrucomicrobiota bacterium]HRY51488.1 type II toxin-antitoxin system VapB family antitoxin [Candidatus Paceibacterota bacterium]
MGDPIGIGNKLDLHGVLCDFAHMATNIELNEVLLTKAMRLGGMKTKKDAVNEALAEYVQRREQLKITELFGEVEFEESFNYKEQRKLQ